MADLNIIEFIVYGFITYSGLLMLIISSIRDTPDTKSHSIVRAVYLIPSAITALIIAFAGDRITSGSISNIIKDLNSTTTWSETVTTELTLIDPIWVTVHFLIFAVILVHVFTQFMQLLTKKD